MVMLPQASGFNWNKGSGFKSNDGLDDGQALQSYTPSGDLMAATGRLLQISRCGRLEGKIRQLPSSRDTTADFQDEADPASEEIRQHREES